MKIRRSLLRIAAWIRSHLLALVSTTALTACGQAPLESFDVTLVTILDCTQNATSQQCVQPEVLASQRTAGRWTFEHRDDNTFSLTDHDGALVSGIIFDGFVDGLDALVEEDPCRTQSGLCYFARRRFQVSDPDNNDCTRFGQFAVVLRRDDDDTFTGRTVDISGTDDRCGTSSVSQRTVEVRGTLADTPALAREEAL